MFWYDFCGDHDKYYKRKAWKTTTAAFYNVVICLVYFLGVFNQVLQAISPLALHNKLTQFVASVPCTRHHRDYQDCIAFVHGYVCATAKCNVKAKSNESHCIRLCYCAVRSQSQLPRRFHYHQAITLNTVESFSKKLFFRVLLFVILFCLLLYCVVHHWGWITQ